MVDECGKMQKGLQRKFCSLGEILFWGKEKNHLTFVKKKRSSKGKMLQKKTEKDLMEEKKWKFF